MFYWVRFLKGSELKIKNSRRGGMDWRFLTSQTLYTSAFLTENMDAWAFFDLYGPHTALKVQFQTIFTKCEKM